jgi:acetate kinase
MRVLVVNAGSSSLKLRVLGDRDEVAAVHEIERWNADSEAGEISTFLDAVPRFDAIGHRVVHGGSDFRAATLVDAATEAALLALSSLAPLHQPRAVAGIHALRRIYPKIPQVVAFDTTFHSTLSPAASTYALPQEWRDQWGLQRFGFHGLSHAYASRRAAELIDRAGDPDVRIVTCHLGSGASLCATRGGRSVDTTMGFTPLEGLVMATRAGSVDPGLVMWLIENGGLAPDTVAAALESQSGLAALSGLPGGDMRDVLTGRRGGDARSVLAFNVYTHRLRRELGAMIAVLGGIDALVFTGGIGEHAAEVRAAACDRLEFAGVRVDPQLNSVADGDREIGDSRAIARTFVIAAREDLEIARQVRALLDPRR